jgi:hypothetical protein
MRSSVKSTPIPAWARRPINTAKCSESSVGDIVQEEGSRGSLDALIEMVAVIAPYYAKLFTREQNIVNCLATNFSTAFEDVENVNQG